ncbi:FecR family protein [Chitinophaga solisilvae]|uniref:FecR family protein n=1 Tax=Chitinophaga solisilvae TaxID=1233460 RepID=UPI00136AF16C|nr:FecR family protein [Chitinophaga solisilvae]
MKLSELEILIDKYLAGKAAAEEKRLVERWLDDPEDGREALSPDKRAELAQYFRSNILARISAGERLPETPPLRIAHQGNRKRFLRIAAALLFVIISAAIIRRLLPAYQHTSPAYTTITAGSGSVTRYVLPDGSTVSLFPGSSIHIPDHFNLSDRKIKASGRVYFEVVPDEKRAFYVISGALETRVLGTSFEVNTLSGTRPAVVVRTGKVAVSCNGRQLATLQMNKRICVDVSEQVPVARVDSVDAAGICSWWNGPLAFSQTPLPEVLQTLSQWYSIPVTLHHERWASEKITMQIEAGLPAAEAMRLLSGILGCQYRITGQQIIIY